MRTDPAMNDAPDPGRKPVSLLCLDSPYGGLVSVPPIKYFIDNELLLFAANRWVIRHYFGANPSAICCYCY